MACEQCSGATGLACEGCGAMLPARAIDRFAALGLPRRFAVDAAEFETKFRELSKRLHPDRFVRAAPADRARAAQATATLNEAYRTLRDESARAEYLVTLETGSLDGNQPVAAEFLHEILELREELDEAAAAGDHARVAALGQAMTVRRDASLGVLRAQLAVWDGARDPAALAEARGELVAMRYYRRYLEACAGYEEGAA